MLLLSSPVSSSRRLRIACRYTRYSRAAGAAGDLPYRKGIAVVTMGKGGLMYEASVGGQKFSYKPGG